MNYNQMRDQSGMLRAEWSSISEDAKPEHWTAIGEVWPEDLYDLTSNLIVDISEVIVKLSNGTEIELNPDRLPLDTLHQVQQQLLQAYSRYIESKQY